jgi:hypothetical protein
MGTIILVSLISSSFRVPPNARRFSCAPLPSSVAERPGYQQFRAVHRAIHRLTHGPTRREHGEMDQRGGIISHTQGSGKSLTMVFLVRKMRTLPTLRRFKVVAVTDRTDLERQLAETVDLTGEPLQKAASIAQLQGLLRAPGAGLVFGMIQKFQGDEEDEVRLDVPAFPVLNEAEEILVLVDEAHRSHTSALHANLLQALPNCARIGFTGTPIVKAAKKATHEIFGSFIDTYTIRESQADIRGALVSIRNELPRLENRHRRVLALFTERGCRITDVQGCVHLLRDERLRVEFAVKLKEFLQSLDTVLPRREGLRYVPAAKRLGFILKATANRTRDERLNLVGAGAKVKALIDRYLYAQGVDPRIPPLDILDADFEAHVGRQESARAQASEMEYAARYHIRRHYQEDPVYYKKLSQRLEEILATLAVNWEALVAALREFTRDLRAGSATDAMGVDPRTEAPFLRLLVDEAAGGRAEQSDLPRLARATVEIVAHIRQEIGRVDFWRNLVAQGELRGWLVHYLDMADLVPLARQEALADLLVQVAKARHTTLVEA